jgi:hypothetical protein
MLVVMDVPLMPMGMHPVNTTTSIKQATVFIAAIPGLRAWSRHAVP